MAKKKPNSDKEFVMLSWQQIQENQEREIREMWARMEKRVKENPLSAKFSALRKSEDPWDRALYRMIAENAFTELSLNEAAELGKKFIQEEFEIPEPEPGSPSSDWWNYEENYRKKTGKKHTDKELAKSSGWKVNTFKQARARLKRKRIE